MGYTFSLFFTRLNSAWSVSGVPVLDAHHTACRNGRAAHRCNRRTKLTSLPTVRASLNDFAKSRQRRAKLPSKVRRRDQQVFSLTSPDLTRAQIRHSSARATHSIEIIAAAAVMLLASASTFANAAENSTRLAREQHACAVVLGLDPSSHRYNACIRSLDTSLSEWDYARRVSTDSSACDRQGLQPGTPAYAVCVVKDVQSR